MENHALFSIAANTQEIDCLSRLLSRNVVRYHRLSEFGRSLDRRAPTDVFCGQNNVVTLRCVPSGLAMGNNEMLFAIAANETQHSLSTASAFKHVCRNCFFVRLRAPHGQTCADENCFICKRCRDAFSIVCCLESNEMSCCL